MNAETPNPRRDSLHDLLKSWKVEAPLPPRFQEGVWRRIAHEEERSASSCSTWLSGLTALLGSLLRKPFGAAAYLSILLTAGGLAGVWSSERYVDQTETDWRTAYLQAVTPDVPFQLQP